MNVDRPTNNFELILKGYSATKSLLYRDKNNKVTSDGLKSVDVIKNISKQIRAINNDEIQKKSTNHKLKAYKKSSFVPVNMLSLETKQKPVTSNNFETQYELDTQLLNVIKDAEAIIDTRIGVTQEFESSFDEMLDNKMTQNEEVVNINSASIKGLKSQCNKITANTGHLNVDLPFQCKSIKELSTKDDIYLSDDKPSQRNENLLNVNLQGNNSNDVLEKSESNEGSLSPILNPNKSIHDRKSLSITYSLDSFEKFEAIAGPILQENTNIESVKRIISSRISNNELLLPNHKGHHNKNNKQHSQILKIKSETSEHVKDTNCGIMIPYKLIEEEILFSSDEETDYMDNQVKELPLTCALETSFYKQEDVLDKTMYVGFQTASNKSIQVLTNSFNKARNRFTDLQNDNEKSSNCLTLTELVEVYDGALKEKSDIIQDRYIDQIDDVHYKDKYHEHKLKSIGKKYAANGIQVEFKTAKGTLINISDKAWGKSKMIFKDIDENPNKMEANSFTVSNVSHYYDNQERINKTVTDEKGILIQTEKAAACISNTQEQIRIDDCMMQEFEESLICLNDNKLHTNFNVTNHPLNINNNNNNKKSVKGNDILNLENLPNSVCGFMTASNKKIKVSEEGVNKIKNIFRDIDFDIANYQSEINKKSKKKLQATETSTHIVYNEEDKVGIKKQITKSITHNNKYKNEEFSCVLRSTFKNPINIKEEISTKSNKILQEFNVKNKLIDNNVNDTAWNKQLSAAVIHNDKQINKVIKGFKTASNHPINISEEVLIKSNKILQDIHFDSELSDIVNKDEEQFFEDIMYKKKDKGLFEGFKTASNKQINITGKGFAICNKILKEFDLNSETIDDDMNKTRCDRFLKNDEREDKDLFQCFKTASNKPIHISEEALVESNKILQDFEVQRDLLTDINKAKCNKEILNNITHNNTAIKKAFIQGFKTASDKLISISEEALAKSKILLDFDNNDNDFMETGANNCKRKLINITEGLNTTSNKQVKTSNEELIKSKNVFQDIPLKDGNDSLTLESHNNKLNMNDLADQKTEFQGFKTANNNFVKISEEALTKSKKLFQDMNSETNLTNKPIMRSKNLKIIGFQTANNECVNISEEALQKSKKIFEDISVSLWTEDKHKLKSDYTTDTIGFKTPTKSNKFKLCDKMFEPEQLLLANENNNMDNIINTEVIKDFENTIYTEDFFNKSSTSKRPSSPILSCPKAKKIKVRSIINNEYKAVDQHITKKNQYAFNPNYKKNKNYKLLDIYKIENGMIKLSHQNTTFNVDNIFNFEFDGARNKISNVKWTINNIKQYFLSSVNNKIIPEGWVENHMKLIILKLISYEKRFPNIMQYICSVNNVMEQLKYRYDRELYNVERPALRKILEKDEVPCRCMVLNVLNIYIDGVCITKTINLTKNVELLLSDGWYCVKATIDKMLVKLVWEGKIVVGTKLFTQGAELLNCEQGVAPWENMSSVRLKIFGNSTRRAHWTARLGFHGNGAILSYLTTVKPEGGKISQLRVIVTRVYPMLFVEKFDDGSTVTRSERLENLYQMKYESEREILMEKVYEEVEKEFSNQDSEDNESMDVYRKSLDSGSQIYQLMKKSRDPVEFRANLMQSQARLLEEYTIKHREMTHQKLQSRVQELLKKRGLNVMRNVVPMLKIRVADIYKTNVTKAVITIWRPNESLLHLLKEGTWVDIFNVVPTAVRYSEVQISAGKQSVFRKSLKVNDQMTSIAKTFQRKCYMIRELTQNPYMCTEYNEIDTVGFVFDIDPSLKDFDSKKQLFQNVFFADENKKIICVNFWGGLKKFGYENILETGQVVACVNLQKRSGNTRKNIPQYRATEFSYFTKTPKMDVSRKICDDLSKQFLNLDRRKFIENCIILRNNCINIKYGNIENISPYRFNNSDYNLSKNKVFINSPVSDINLNLNGLDFESTFKQSDTVFSPKRLLRKKEINEKIAKLEKYGEPPPIASIHIVNKNKNAAKPYKSPLLSKNEANTANKSNLKPVPPPATKQLILNRETASNVTNSSVDVASDIKKSTNSGCTSPVLPYRCRSVNPVKLNFSKRYDVSKDDPFREEIESSPPLSLD